MEITIAMGLTKQAKSKGGDRYDGELASGEKINIYVPQEISRGGTGSADGYKVETIQPAESIELTITTVS